MNMLIRRELNSSDCYTKPINHEMRPQDHMGLHIGLQPSDCRHIMTYPPQIPVDLNINYKPSST